MVFAENHDTNRINEVYKMILENTRWPWHL
jgi:hypothetical protein